MKPGQYPLRIEKGKTLDLLITWRDQKDNIVDLSNCAAVMELFDGVDGDFVAGFWELGGKIELGGVKGTIHILLPADSSNAPFWDSVGAYKLQLHDLNAEIIELLEGPVEFL